MHNGNLPQQRNIHLLRKLLGAFLTEDVILVLRQFGRRKPRHVLYQAKDRHVHLIIRKHVDTFAGIGQSHRLRRADNNSSGHGKRLHYGEVNVAGSGRKVYQEIIQFAPVGIGNQLFQGIACHTAAPQGSLVGVYEETDRQQLDTILFDRDNQITAADVLCIRTCIFHLKHLGHGRTEDVGIQQTYLIPQFGKGHSQICRYGGLAYTAFTGRHADDVLHLRQQFAHFRACRLTAFRGNRHFHFR